MAERVSSAAINPWLASHGISTAGTVIGVPSGACPIGRVTVTVTDLHNDRHRRNSTEDKNDNHHNHHNRNAPPFLLLFRSAVQPTFDGSKTTRA
jgi:hypothetical protein